MQPDPTEPAPSDAANAPADPPGHPASAPADPLGGAGGSGPVSPDLPGRRPARRLALRLTALGAVVLVAAVVATWAIGRGGHAATPTPAGRPSSSPVAAAAMPTAPCTWAPNTRSDVTLRDVGTPPATVPSTGTAVMTITTNLGVIRITMDAAKTPCTVASFAYLASRHFFDNSQCHRLLDAAGLSLLQCGDPTGTGNGGPTYQVPDENLAALPTHAASPPMTTYQRGVVAMANIGEADTNGSQFFMMFRAGELTPTYTQFGTVTEGMDVLTKVVDGGDDHSLDDGPGGGHPNVKLVFESVTVSYS